MQKKPIRPTRSDLVEQLVYHKESGQFYWRNDCPHSRRGMRAGTTRSDGYRDLRINGFRCVEHHIVWLWEYGKFPSFEIDHINLIKDDNRIENLRLASKSQQQANTRLSTRNTSGYRGVSWCKKRGVWRASIKHSGKFRTLGQFGCPTAAAIEFDRAAIDAFGEFATPNLMTAHD